MLAAIAGSTGCTRLATRWMLATPHRQRPHVMGAWACTGRLQQLPQPAVLPAQLCAQKTSLARVLHSFGASCHHGSNHNRLTSKSCTSAAAAAANHTPPMQISCHRELSHQQLLHTIPCVCLVLVLLCLRCEKASSCEGSLIHSWVYAAVNAWQPHDKPHPLNYPSNPPWLGVRQHCSVAEPQSLHCRRAPDRTLPPSRRGGPSATSPCQPHQGQQGGSEP